MEREPNHYEWVPLGENPKVVRISKDEMHLAYLHRLRTREPIQSWVRRLIRENWNVVEPPAASDASNTESEE